MKKSKIFQADQELDARVNLKVYREKTAKVEVTIPLGSITLRAEDVSQDMYGSIDLVTDKIERQIRKNKTKIERKTVIKNQLASCLQMLSLKKRKLHLQKSFAPNKLT